MSGKEIKWWEPIEPKTKAGNWVFIEPRLTLRNVKTNYTIHLTCLTSPAKVLDRLSMERR